MTRTQVRLARPSLPQETTDSEGRHPALALLAATWASRGCVYVGQAMRWRRRRRLHTPEELAASSEPPARTRIKTIRETSALPSRFPLSYTRSSRRDPSASVLQGRV